MRIELIASCKALLDKLWLANASYPKHLETSLLLERALHKRVRLGPDMLDTLGSHKEGPLQASTVH